MSNHLISTLKRILWLHHEYLPVCRTEQETGWNRTDQVTGQKAAVMYSWRVRAAAHGCQACSSALWTAFPLANTAVSQSFKVGSPQSGFANVYLILVLWMFI